MNQLHLTHNRIALILEDGSPCANTGRPGLDIVSNDIHIIFITTFIVPAQIVLGIWFIMQLSGGLNSLGINTTGGVAWFAHIGGFLVGVGSLKVFQTFHLKHNE